MKVKFNKKSIVPSSSLTTGTIYFESSTGLIKVAVSDNSAETYGEGTIKAIKVNESPLVISDKNVTIPNAAAEVYGVITENRVKTLAGEVAGSVYRVKGTKATIDEVLAVGTASVGDVYNVTAEFTLNSQKYPAGTNVVFVGPGEEGEPDPTQQTQWDALGGTVDLTPYATTSYVNTELGKKVNTSTQINGNTLTGNVTLDGSDIALTGYTKASTEAAVSASDSINGAIGKLERGIEVAKAYADKLLTWEEFE